MRFSAGWMRWESASKSRPVGPGDDDLAVEHAAVGELAARAPRPARGSSGSAASRCGCPARPRPRPGRRCSGSRPTSARRRGRRSRGSSRASLASMGDTGRADGERHRAISHRATPPRPAGRPSEPRLTMRSGSSPASTALLAAAAEPFELPGRVGVGVDAERAAEPGRLAQQVLGRVLALGPRVDLHRRPGAGAGGEHRLGVEGRLGPAPPRDEAAGAVAQDVGVGALDGGEHTCGHLGRVHAQLGVDAGHHDVELGQQVEVLVERPVLEDVHLDAGQDPERRQLAR